MRFNKIRHEHHLEKWILDRGMSPKLLNELPSIGWIIFDEETPVCAGFIRKFEKCAFGMVDSWISNPLEKSEVRNEALEMLTKVMMAQSFQLGFDKLICHTVDQNIAMRAEKFGFERAAGVWMGVQLKGKSL